MLETASVSIYSLTDMSLYVDDVKVAAIED